MHLPSPVTAEHIAFASAHLLELEAQHAPREKRNEARRRWKALTRHWRLQRMSGEAAQGREVDGMSIANTHVGAGFALRQMNGTGTHG